MKKIKIPSEYEQWIDSLGIIFLQSLGMNKNCIVLDFGCRHGTYAIPAAKVVGNDGRVYVIDKDMSALNALMKTADELGLKNIKRFHSSEKIHLPFDAATFDMVLLFDVLHLVENRRSLISQLYNVLKQRGILLLYPRHHKEHMQMDLDEVIKMVEKLGFHFSMKTYKQLMHDDKLINDWVLVFHKN
jgi:ubiquinone/menaquinone biosynthesis C-methylase UbiE